MMPNETIKRLQRGYNVLELMVVLFVGSILLGVGIPGFNGFIDSGRMTAAVNDLTTSIHIARTEAIKRKSVIVVCPTLNHSSSIPECSWANEVSFADGWMVFEDSQTLAAANMVPESEEAVLYAHGPIAGDLKVDAAARNGADIGAARKYIMFDSDGFPEPAFFFTPATFNIQLCDGRGDGNTGGGVAAGRWIQLTATGRPQIHRTQEALESDANPLNGCSS